METLLFIDLNTDNSGAVVGRVCMVLDIQLPMQSVHTTSKVVGLNLTHGKVYSIQHYMISLSIDLRQVCGSQGTLVSSTNKNLPSQYN